MQYSFIKQKGDFMPPEAGENQKMIKNCQKLEKK